MVFDGEELLEFAIKSIRHVIDYISVTYQAVSYFGNPASKELLPLLQRLQREGLVDELLYYETDLSIHHKENELRLRNMGLEASRRAGCTHHISADVDEFYKPNEVVYAKQVMEDGDFDFSIVQYVTYYKEPTYVIIGEAITMVTFIHPINNEYRVFKEFPFKIEDTRRLSRYEKYKVFTRDEIAIHHMSYVRKDIRKKLENSDNGRFYKINQFVDGFNKYKLGDRLCITPDFINRRTKEVPNTFNITFE